MKKLFTIALMSAAVLTAGAQKSVQGSKFFDNWSIGLVGGGIVKTTHSDFIKDARATYGVELGKQITPVVGFGLQYLANNNTTPSQTIFDQHNLSLLGKINFSNWFCGYNGTPRLFEVEGVLGLGWQHNYNHNNGTRGCNDDNYMTGKAGFNFNFNLGEAKAWTVALKPSIVYNTTSGGHQHPVFNVNNSAIEVLAGVTYHFKNHNNGKHYMTLVKAYDQAEVDGLNSKINDLRASVSDKDAQLAKANAENRELQQTINDLRNRKPVVETKTVTNNTASLEQTVTFRQGKSVVDASQLPNVERVATFLKNHKNSTVDIKGYASPEGSAEVNAKIAKARAEAVKTILVNKYKIAANRITAEGQGVGNMFSEDDWNRVSICTINETSNK